MKKIILFLFLPSLCETYNAQSYAPLDAGKTFRTDVYYDAGYDINWLGALSGGKKIRSVESSSSKKKDNQLIILNEQGQVTERKEYRFVQTGPFWKKHYYHEKTEYSNGLAARLFFYDKKEQMLSEILYEYFTPNKLKHSVFIHRGKKKMEKTAEFNSDSNIVLFTSYKFKKGKAVPKVRYEYEYYPDRQNKETRMYNSRNRLKYVWKYDCNPKGEIKKEKESQVCKNTTTDNRGRLVETTFNTTSKGRKTKTVHTYYVFGGKNVEVQLENYIIEKGVERKWYQAHFADSIEKYYEYTYYDRRGRISSQGRTEYSLYNSMKKIVSLTAHSYYSRNKLVFRNEMKFNEKGMPLGGITTGSKNKVIGRTEFNYQGDSGYTISHYNKKQKPSRTYTVKIEYYLEP